jgi:hypothetical protein
MDFVPDTAKWGTYADIREKPDGTLVEVWRTHCANGHPITRCGHYPCPRPDCEAYVRGYLCDDGHCGGMVTSRAHETVCPPG